MKNKENRRQKQWQTNAAVTWGQRQELLSHSGLTSVAGHIGGVWVILQNTGSLRVILHNCQYVLYSLR
jgi:hypothetical protein